MLTENLHNLFYGSVQQFAETFGNPVSKEMTTEAASLYTALVDEEFAELAEAETEVDRLDAICDLIYVQYNAIVHMGRIDFLSFALECTAEIYLLDRCIRLAEAKGYDLVKAFKEVHRSNMSKLVAKDDIPATIEWYQRNRGVESFEYKEVVTELEFGKRGQSMYIMKAGSDAHEYGIKKGKVLKSIGYSPAELTPYI